VFALSFLAVHVIDERSPLFGVTAVQLRESNANLIVTFTGIDDRLATNVHARYVWSWNDIVYDHRFADLFRVDPQTHRRYLDLAPMHETEPVTSSSASPAVDPASPG
jgi:inward rectifier potassium channel